VHNRLRQTISSFGSKQDTPISAIVIQPVELDGQIVLPMNTELHGVVERVRRVGVGLSHETAQLDLRFDTLILPKVSRSRWPGRSRRWTTPARRLIPKAPSMEFAPRREQNATTLGFGISF